MWANYIDQNSEDEGDIRESDDESICFDSDDENVIQEEENNMIKDMKDITREDLNNYRMEHRRTLKSLFRELKDIRLKFKNVVHFIELLDKRSE